VIEENQITLSGVFVELQKVTISFVMCLSVILDGTAWFSMVGFELNLIFQGFLKICPENSGFIKI
jgi:hypothetical protein